MTQDWLVRLPRDGEPEVVAGTLATAAARDVTVLFDGTLFDEAEPAAALLDAYLRSGPRAFPRLRGRFTLLVWDGRAGELHALRDPTGMRPLFHAAGSGGELLAPSIDALLAAPGVARDADPLYVAGQLIMALSSHPDETAFPAVRRVPPGHVLRVRGGRATSGLYWDPFGEVAAGRDTDERFGELLERAVRRAGRRPAVMLSGGIDSALVATAAARTSAAPVALSILNPTPEADESWAQRRVAAELGVEQLAAAPADVVPAGEILTRSVELAPAWAWPPGALQSVGVDLASQAAAKGCDVLLTGDGGDEWLMPFASLAPPRLLRLDLRTIRDLHGAWGYLSPGVSGARLARGVAWRGTLRPMARAALLRAAPAGVRARLERRMRDRAAASFPEWLLPGRRGDLAQWWIERYPRGPLLAMHEVEKRHLQSAPFASALMESQRSIARRCGLDVVSPLWDADVVAFAASLPPERLIQGGVAKALARTYMRPHLSFADRWPAKTFGDSVVARMLETEGEAAWRRLAGVTALTQLGAVDPNLLSCLFTGRQGRRSLRAWDVVSVEGWLRTRL